MFAELGTEHKKTLLLLPGTCYDWQTNFGTVVDSLSSKYRLICVNYDGFDGTDSVFDSVVSQTEKIEKYLIENHEGKIDGALDSSLGGSFAAQLVLRQNVHIIYALKMGKKYEKRYRKYFADPDIRPFAMQHEAWLFGEKRWEDAVLATIDEWMGE